MILINRSWLAQFENEMMVNGQISSNFPPVILIKTFSFSKRLMSKDNIDYREIRRIFILAHIRSVYMEVHICIWLSGIPVYVKKFKLKSKTLINCLTKKKLISRKELWF